MTFSTAGDDLLGTVTHDELSVAWTTSASSVVTVHYVDRASTSVAFGAAQTVTGAFADDRAALSADGLRLVLVNADRKGFSELTRAARGDAFGAPGEGTYSFINAVALQAGELYSDPVLSYYDKTFYYSLYGGSSVDTIRVARRLFNGDPWNPQGAAWTVTQLQAQGGMRRRPTGLSSDERALFFWDEVANQERVGFVNANGVTFDSFADLGARSRAQPNDACTRLYFSGAGASSIDLFTAQPL